MALPLPERPDCEVADIADEIGLAMSGGMGAAPLSALEIRSWCDLAQVDLSPWEFRMLRAMSQAFVSGMQSEESPVVTVDPVIMRMAVANATMERM